MRRRTFVQAMAGAVTLAAFPARVARTAAASLHSDAWKELRAKVGARLIPVHSPLVDCARAHGAEADALFAKLKNPYYFGDEPALTQTMGWIDAWVSRPSAMAVAATSAADVVAAIEVARRHRLKLVVKGGGHSYFGNSNAADSLLIWTRRMDRIELHDGFSAAGWAPGRPAVPAVSVGAGAIWGRVYDEVSVKAGRYVQGGGCLTVGVAGFVQGGGFGSLSKAFGTGAANLLEAEVVTADGRVRTVSDASEPELFHALRGGGGGTFGVVTRVTLKTHPLPATINAALFDVTAASDEDWRHLVARITDHYADHLFGPVWGEQLRFAPGRKLSVAMIGHGLDQAGVQAAWAPFLDWLARAPTRYRLGAKPVLLAVPARQFWNPDFLGKLPGVVLRDDRSGAPADNIFWATNLSEAGQTLNAYQSAWLPQRLLARAERQALVDAIVAATAHWSVALHLNKGLAGGAPEALAATRDTATNPQVLDAFALLICAADAVPSWPGIPGHQPDVATGRREAGQVRAAMAEITKVAPGAGCYMSEADYFQPDWKRAYWGPNYSRLAVAKRRYDPAGLFTGHHCVEPA